MRYIFSFAILVLIASCAVSQKQGLHGKVFWVSGNMMPGPDKKMSPKDQGVVREILIYPALTNRQVQSQDGFFSISSEPVARVKSKEDGSFNVQLPAGKYSVFTKEEKGLFANMCDGDGCINCVDIKPGKYSTHTITINYNAAY